MSDRLDQSQNAVEEQVVARLSALLFDFGSSTEQASKQISGQAGKSNSEKVSVEISERTSKQNPLASLYPEPIAEDQALQQLQNILVEPGLEELATTVDLMAARLEQVEQVVGDPRLGNKLAEIESQLAEQTSQNQAELAAIAQQQRNIPLQVSRLDQEITQIKTQIYSPDALLELLLPIMGELLRRKVNLSETEICEALVPLIDSLIRRRTEQDHLRMSEVIAVLIPEAISQAIAHFPQQTAKALAPEVALAIEQQINLDQEAIANALAPQIGASIKQQILLERDAMVDALYPVIGSTISKYLAEAIRAINQKVESAFSFEGLQRKIKGKLQGVSEAELILQESLPFAVKAIFLIHKSSGLVIADLQSPDTHLESDMIAGMLTAIRSFANDCLAQPGSDLDQIEYGTNRICLEIAGYCYLAIVSSGSPSPPALAKIRRTFADLLQAYGKQLENFDGDPSMLPAELHQSLERLTRQLAIAPEASKPPYALITIGLSLVAGIGWHLLSSHHHLALIQRSQTAIAADPALTIYPIQVQLNQGQIILKGKVPYPSLKARAAALALGQYLGENLNIQNQIQVANLPPTPELIAAEVARNTQFWRRQYPIQVQHQDQQVKIQGQVPAQVAPQIVQSFSQLPGITQVISELVLVPPPIKTILYFEPEQDLPSATQAAKLPEVIKIAQAHPQFHLEISGYSDGSGSSELNRQLAIARAQQIKALLQAQISNSITTRIGAVGFGNNQSLWQERRVKFRLYLPQANHDR
ncbi:MAG: OmpA family protein [Pseudanabaenaceae cyanobacterium bins.68]|nr:OmpA family protein [Pseudanabaenaceae cyanobacterium bins.68]